MQWNSKFFLTVEFKEKVDSGSLKPEKGLANSATY